MRNRYIGFLICIGFALMSAPALRAQTENIKASESSQVGTQKDVLQARLVDSSALTLTNEAGLPDAPAATPAPNPSPAKKSQQGAPGAASVGSFGIDSRVATASYWGVTAAMFGASVADAELTVRCQEKKTCSYMPPSLRSRAALYGIGIPADVGISYLGYKLKQHSLRFWYIPQAFITGANVYVAIHAYRRSQQTP